MWVGGVAKGEPPLPPPLPPLPSNPLLPSNPVAPHTPQHTLWGRRCEFEATSHQAHLETVAKAVAGRDRANLDQSHPAARRRLPRRLPALPAHRRGRAGGLHQPQPWRPWPGERAGDGQGKGSGGVGNRVSGEALCPPLNVRSVEGPLGVWCGGFGRWHAPVRSQQGWGKGRAELSGTARGAARTAEWRARFCRTNHQTAPSVCVRYVIGWGHDAQSTSERKGRAETAPPPVRSLGTAGGLQSSLSIVLVSHAQKATTRSWLRVVCKPTSFQVGTGLRSRRMNVGGRDPPSSLPLPRRAFLRLSRASTEKHQPLSPQWLHSRSEEG